MASTPSATPTSPVSHVVTPTDHSAFVTISTSILLVASMIFLGIRLMIRWPWPQTFGSDDYSSLASSIFGLIQSSLVFGAVHWGLGRHVDDIPYRDVINAEKCLYAGDLFFVVTVCAARLAIAGLILRLTNSKRHNDMAIGLAVFIALSGLASILALAVRRNASRPWDMQLPGAVNILDAWIGVTIVGVITEAALLIFPVVLVWGLQMPLSSKLTVLAGFAFRIPVPAVAIVRIVYGFRAVRAVSSSFADYTWRGATPVILMQIEMHYIIIAATIPCMRLFLKSFETGYLGTTADQVDPTATMLATKGSNSYGMSSFGSSSGRRTSQAPGGGIRGHLRSVETDLRSKVRADKPFRPKEDGHTSSRAYHDDMEIGSLASDGSDKIIIKKTVQVEYDTKNERSTSHA